MLEHEGSQAVPFSLLKGRLGIHSNTTTEQDENGLKGIQHQSVRFRQHGGHRQQERMIRDKRRSLDSAIWYSYQGAEVLREGAMVSARALINPNKVKQDYDDKIISVGFEHGFKCGDVFEWVGTNTHWLIYLQDLTELAYFRGDIRKCSYTIDWEDADGIYHSTHVALKGPTQQTINSVKTHGISADSPNYTLNLLLPKNEFTLQYFTRYNKFYLQGHDTCWRVEAVDQFSTPGILEVAAMEYYANNIEDDIEAGIVGGLLVDKPNPNEVEIEETILGETFIKVKKQYTYTFRGRGIHNWMVDQKYPVKLIQTEDPREIILSWESTYSGQFELSYGKYTKTIVVESLF